MLGEKGSKQSGKQVVSLVSDSQKEINDGKPEFCYPSSDNITKEPSSSGGEEGDEFKQPWEEFIPAKSRVIRDEEE